jgi:hypothetical protein
MRNPRFEISQPWPEGALVQIYFGDAHGSPFLRRREHAAVLPEDRGEHPVPRDILLSAADDVNLFLAPVSRTRGRGPARDCSPTPVVPVPFNQSGHNVELMFLAQSAEVIGRRARNAFRAIRIGRVDTGVGKRLAEHDQVCFNVYLMGSRTNRPS